MQSTITFDNTNIISHETFKLYQSRKRNRELIDEAAQNIREARLVLQNKLIADGWPADLMPHVNPSPTPMLNSGTVMAAWWVNNNGHPT